MKVLFQHSAIALLFFLPALFACKRELSCEGCRETNKPPTAAAGPDQVITLPLDSVVLDGNRSSDPDGKISAWQWTKITGPASFTIVSATLATTTVKNLKAGSYQFELKVTDDKGASARDTVMITVDSIATRNHPPVACAGSDQIITLPTNTVTLDGSCSTDPDSNIVSYAWTKISGPSSFNIVNVNAVQTQVSNLTEGTYQFELKVTDVGGLFSKDTVLITVNAVVSAACDNSNRPNVNAQLIPVRILSGSPWAVASAGNKIAFIDSRTIVIFDIILHTWSTEDLILHTWSPADLDLSGQRRGIAVIGAGNKIFFAGGDIAELGATNIVDIYDVSTNTWTVSNLSRGSDLLSAATCGNKVFFAGGNLGIYASNIVDIYDLTTNTWSTASLSAPRNLITAVSATNKVYFTGGDPWTGLISNVIDIYNNITNRWSTSTMQVPRVDHAAAAVNDILYFAGGINNTSSYATTCSVESLNTITGARTLMNLFGPAPWYTFQGQNAVVKDSKIIFLRYNGETDANKFDVYDTQTNTWSIGVLPQPIAAGASVISVNNTIYVAGGEVNGVLSNQVWKLEF